MLRQAGLVASSGYSSDASDMEAPHPAAPTLPPVSFCCCGAVSKRSAERCDADGERTRRSQVWVDLVDTLEADVRPRLSF
jgi:hypothetical protein